MIYISVQISFLGDYFKDIINPYNCLLKNANFSVKTSNEEIRSYIIK